MSKYHDIASLAQEVSARIVRNEAEWTRYLTTAARLYKYPFKEQMLIYAQRPDATACASILTWNEKMNCWVNKAAKGIALIDEDSDRNKLKYVFDVSDVHKASRIGRDPNLWVLQEEQKQAVIIQLEKTYGTTNKAQTFEKRLMELSNRIAEDFYPDLIADMEYVKEGSFLEGLDEQNTEIRVRETLSSSISFVLLSRCGFDMEEFKNELNFDYIHDFSSMETLSILGNATTDMAQPILMEIGRTIGAYERNKAKTIAYGEQFATPDENSKKQLANDSNKHYNTLMRESKMRNHKNDTNEFADTERGMPHEYHIREERGLLDSKPSSEQGNSGNIDEIWTDEKELFKGSSQWDLHRNASENPPEPPGPKIDKSGAKNFQITDDALGVGSAKEKFRSNVTAIKTVEIIEAESRIATPEEQQILSKYVGWGGLSEAFDDAKSNWANEYQELKALLSSEEYASARESTLNAHYTSPTIIRGIYTALANMGFEKGNILEPAMGIGNFLGMLPENMQRYGGCAIFRGDWTMEH